MRNFMATMKLRRRREIFFSVCVEKGITIAVWHNTKSLGLNVMSLNGKFGFNGHYKKTKNSAVTMSIYHNYIIIKVQPFW